VLPKNGFDQIAKITLGLHPLENVVGHLIYGRRVADKVLRGGLVVTQMPEIADSAREVVLLKVTLPVKGEEQLEVLRMIDGTTHRAKATHHLVDVTGAANG
jgi:mannitol/fructose-specific phosphotransferase system IIA component